MNKVENSLAKSGDEIPEHKVRRFVSAVEKRNKKKAHAKKCAKQRQKRK